MPAVRDHDPAVGVIAIQRSGAPVPGDPGSLMAHVEAEGTIREVISGRRPVAPNRRSPAVLSLRRMAMSTVGRHQCGAQTRHEHSPDRAYGSASCTRERGPRA